MNKAVFLDRDGVINKIILRNNIVSSPYTLEEFEFIENIEQAVLLLKQAGFVIIVITNQPDISRNKLSWDNLKKINNLIKEKLLINDILVCHHDNYHNCACRKPKPGMLFYSAVKLEIDLEKSFFIGDTKNDMLAAQLACCKGILVNTNYNKEIESFKRVDNIMQAVNFILNY